MHDDSGDLVLVIDLGTSSVKVSAFPPSGGPVASADRPYPISTPRPGWAEQDAETWWSSSIDAGSEVVARVGAERVAAVTVTNQQVSSVPLDEELRPLAPAILWMDTRTAPIAARLRSSLHDTVLHTVGMPISTSWATLRILWWLEERPEIARRARWFATPDAFLYGRLTGTVVSDESNACFGPFDLAERRWSSDLTSALGVDPSRLPAVVPPAGALDPLLPSVARQLGLPGPVPVIAGASDQPSSAVGLGVIDPASVAITVGTGTFVVLPTPSPEADARYMVNCAGVPGQWIRYGLHYVSGALVEWWGSVVDCTPVRLVSVARESVPGANGVVVLPYLQGARTPRFDDDATGAVFGLTLSHTDADVARAVFESNAHGIRQILDVMSPGGGEEIRLAGGGIADPLIPQMIADVTGRPVVAADNPQSTSLGAALLARTAIDPSTDLATAWKATASPARPFAPDDTARRVHDERHATYLDLSERLRPPFGRDSSTRIAP